MDCTQCSGSRYLHQNECLLTCPATTYGYYNECKLCHASCFTCSA